MHPLFLREGQKVVAFWGGFLPQDRFTHPELTNANSTLPQKGRVLDHSTSRPTGYNR